MGAIITKKQIKKLLKKENPVILEIGSHYGEDTEEFLDTFKDIKLFCFEPDPRNIQIIKKYRNLSKFKLYELALSDTDNDSVDFYMSYKEPEDYQRMFDKYKFISQDDYKDLNINRSGASSLKSGHEAVKDAKIVKVKTKKLDTWARENNIDKIDFIWVDVQGAEREVLLGGEQILKNTDYIFIEYGETDYEGGMTREETIRFLENLNFQVISKYSDKEDRGNLLFRSDKIKQKRFVWF